MTQSFEPIGPYALGRVDQLVGGLVVSFWLGSPKVRLICWAYLIGLLGAAAFFAASGHLEMATLGVFLALLLFVLTPLIRSPKLHKRIVVTPDDQGIHVDTANTVTIYKWATIGRTMVLLGRLFVMVRDGVALVVPERASSAGNIHALVDYIEVNRRANHS